MAIQIMTFVEFLIRSRSVLSCYSLEAISQHRHSQKFSSTIGFCPKIDNSLSCLDICSGIEC